MNINSQTTPPHSGALLFSRRFAPLFFTQFLGAVNDNIFKAGLLIYLSHTAAEELAVSGGQLVTIAGGLFILPFLLFSALAGQLADSRERSAITRAVKLWEIVLMSLAAWCFYLPASTASIVGLFVLIFLMGAQSTLFGPIKYSLIPDHLPAEEVLTGNSLVGSSTFAAILIGTIGGSLLISIDNPVWLGSSLLGLAVCGWGASLLIPRARIANPGGALNANPISGIVSSIKHTRVDQHTWRCILGISWFWTIGAIFLTQLPHYTAAHLGQGATTVTLFLGVLLLGIGIGALVCPLIFKRRPRLAYLIPCLIIMSLAIALFSLQSLFWNPGICASDCPDSLNSFFHLPLQALALLMWLLAIAIAGGIFIVPLYVSVQFHSDRKHLSRTIATNNILNALFIVASSVVSSLVYAVGGTVIDLLFVTGVFTLGYLLLLPGPIDGKQQ